MEGRGGADVFCSFLSGGGGGFGTASGFVGRGGLWGGGATSFLFAGAGFVFGFGFVFVFRSECGGLGSARDGEVNGVAKCLLVEGFLGRWCTVGQNVESLPRA